MGPVQGQGEERPDKIHSLRPPDGDKGNDKAMGRQ